MAKIPLDPQRARLAAALFGARTMMNRYRIFFERLRWTEPKARYDFLDVCAYTAEDARFQSEILLDYQEGTMDGESLLSAWRIQSVQPWSDDTSVQDEIRRWISHPYRLG